MITYDRCKSAFQELGLPGKSCIVHASLSALGQVEGGCETLLKALLDCSPGVMAPTFTYKTMLIPETGPDDNAMTYGSGRSLNRMAEPFTRAMPADRMMGSLPETLRQLPGASRSTHPILSFAGIEMDASLASQSLEDPLAPLACLAETGGVVLLLGVNHTVNTAIHWVERLALSERYAPLAKPARQRSFIRWALTPGGVVACPGFPGCSNGFEKAAPFLSAITRRVRVGAADARLLPLAEMADLLSKIIREDPLAFLCDREDCERCECIKRSFGHRVEN